MRLNMTIYNYCCISVDLKLFPVLCHKCTAVRIVVVSGNS